MTADTDIVDLKTGEETHRSLRSLVTTTHRSDDFVYTVPHAGTLAPQSLVEAWNLDRRSLQDADLHTEKLFSLNDGIKVETSLNRYVVNMNRPPWRDGAVNEYEEEDSLRTFLKGMEPSWKEPIPDDVKEELLEVYQVYHAEISAALEQARTEPAFLLTCHSMNEYAASNTPDSGRRPDITVCTEHGRAAPDTVIDVFVDVFEASPFQVRVDEPYAGGYTTRHYAMSRDDVVGIQLEINKATYMDEDTFEYDAEKGQLIRRYVKRCVERTLNVVEKKSGLG